MVPDVEGNDLYVFNRKRASPSQTHSWKVHLRCSRNCDILGFTAGLYNHHQAIIISMCPAGRPSWVTRESGQNKLFPLTSCLLHEQKIKQREQNMLAF